MKQDYSSLLFGVQRSVRYHMRRCRFFDGVTRATNALSLIFGSSTLFVLFYEMPSEQLSWTKVIPAIVGAVSIMALVYEAPRMARLHSELARKYIELEQKMISVEPPADESGLKQFQAQKLEIEVDEPPIHRVLDLLCRNEMIHASGYDKAKLYPATRFERLTAQILHLEPKLERYYECGESHHAETQSAGDLEKG